jgi:dihydroorotate dehydrogenase
MMYRFLVSILFVFFKDPETVHRLALLFLKCLGTPIVRDIAGFFTRVENPALHQILWGIDFKSPVGIAAGFDKEGEVIRGISALGFGYIETGTITKYPQEGNPRPRMFRFPEEGAIINRMGFNNKGAGRMGRRLMHMHADIPVGISLGKSKRAELDEAAEDYRFSFERLYEYGDYFVINVSSPNTPGLRQLQDKKFLVDIVRTLNGYRTQQKKRKPLLVKIAPDLSYEAIDEVLNVCREEQIDGIIAVNTTVSRKGVSEDAVGIAGGLSGLPLQKLATDIIRHIHGKAPELPIIGVGGIFTAEDAYEKIKAGATLVQVYTGFIYEGPGIAANINRGLLKLLARDGYKNISEAVGKA